MLETGKTLIEKSFLNSSSSDGLQLNFGKLEFVAFCWDHFIRATSVSKKTLTLFNFFSSLTSTDTKFWKSQHLIRSHLIFFHLQYVTKHVIFSRLSLSFSRSFYENEKCQIKLTSAARLNKRSWLLISAFNLRIYKVSFIVENRVEQFVAVVNFIVDLAQLIILSKLNHLFPMSSVSVVAANVKHNRTAGL